MVCTQPGPHVPLGALYSVCSLDQVSERGIATINGERETFIARTERPSGYSIPRPHPPPSLRLHEVDDRLTSQKNPHIQSL
jgi:hypothetical protein